MSISEKSQKFSYPKHFIQLLHISGNNDYGALSFEENCSTTRGIQLCMQSEQDNGVYYCEKHDFNLRLETFYFNNEQDCETAAVAIESGMENVGDYDHMKSTTTEVVTGEYLSEDAEKKSLQDASLAVDFEEDDEGDDEEGDEVSDDESKKTR
jgi:hypothetical protein